MARLVMAGLVGLGLVAAVVPTVGLGQGSGQQGDPNASRMMMARQTLTSLTNDLREAQSSLRGISDINLRNRIELVLTRAQLRASELDRSLSGLAVPAYPTRTVGVTSPADLNDQVNALKKRNFDDQRVSFVQGLGTTRRYTSSQASELLKTFDFDDGRGKAAVLLYPSLVDPENFYKALDTFTFDSNRKKVLEQIKPR